MLYSFRYDLKLSIAVFLSSCAVSCESIKMMWKTFTIYRKIPDSAKSLYEPRTTTRSVNFYRFSPFQHTFLFFSLHSPSGEALHRKSGFSATSPRFAPNHPVKSAAGVSHHSGASYKIRFLFFFKRRLLAKIKGVPSMAFFDVYSKLRVTSTVQKTATCILLNILVTKKEIRSWNPLQKY